jgi:flagellar biosynthesis protein FlhF
MGARRHRPQPQGAPQGQDLVDRGGIYALVGPTGVGKTTTVAKLAARAVLKHGANKVAMITTDSYRIGAQDQLRIYGRILGAPVFAVRDENDLELTLLDHTDKHLVLIDTIGMSQRDRRVAEQINMLCGEEQR